MSGRGLSVLAVLLIAILSVVLWIDRPPTDDKKADEAKPLLAIPEAEVRRIEIEHGGASATFERRGDHAWAFVAPRAGEADPRRVDELLRALKDARVAKVVAEKGADGASFGLDRPESAARIFTKREAPATVRIGRKSPVGSERYASLGDGRVVLVDASLATALERAPEEFEEHRLIPLEAEEIRRIRIVRPEGTLTLARDGNDWKVLEPFADRADEAAADSLARAVTSLSVSRREEAPKAASAKVPPIAVEIETASAGTKRVTIEDGFARRADGTLAGPVADAGGKDLHRDAAELRDRRIANVPAQDVREVRVESAGRVLRVRREKEDGAWTLPEAKGPAGPVDGRKVDALLDRLRWARVETFETAAAPKGEQVVTVKGKDDKELVRLEIGPAAKPGTLTVRSTFRPGLLMTVTSEALAPLPNSPADLAPDLAPGAAPAEAPKGNP